MASLRRNRDAPPGRAEGILPNIKFKNAQTNDITPGDNITISGTIGWDRIDFPGAAVDTRVRFVSPGVQPVTKRVARLGRGDSSPFNVEFDPGAVSAGDEIVVNGEVQYQPRLRNKWRTVSRQSFRVQVIPQEQQQARAATGYLPYAAGGAAVGALYSRQTKGFVDRTTALAGAGIGITGRAAFGGFSIPSFPTKNALVLAALLGAGAFAVNQASNISTPDPSVVTDRLPGSGSGSGS